MSTISSTSSASSYWQSIQDTWKKGVQEVEEDVTAVSDAIGSAYDAVEDAVESVSSSVSEVVSDGAVLVKETWDTVGSAIDTYI